MTEPLKRERVVIVGAGFGGLAAAKRLAAAPDLHPVQQAMLDEQALQCGYCYNGMIVKAAELLSRNPRPTDAQIRSAMNGHICRCGTYPNILRAVRRAADAMAGGRRVDRIASRVPR
jgi:aerobic-type carbon monoxide dehydrogenase small subunit (CoxS/CutS family)